MERDFNKDSLSNTPEFKKRKKVLALVGLGMIVTVIISCFYSLRAAALIAFVWIFLGCRYKKGMCETIVDEQYDYWWYAGDNREGLRFMWIGLLQLILVCMPFLCLYLLLH